MISISKMTLLSVCSYYYMMMMIFIVSLQHVVIIHTTTILAVEIQVQNDNVDNPIFQQMMQYYKNKESVINWRRDFHRICINLDGLMINRILSLSGNSIDSIAAYYELLDNIAKHVYCSCDSLNASLS